MAEVADMMLEGFLCQHCGVMIDGREPGFPRDCPACREPNRPPKRRKRRKTGPYQRRAR